MINPIFQKSFLEKLYATGFLTLAEAMALLSPAKTPKLDELSAALQFLWTEDLFSIHSKNSDEELWLEKPMLKQADDYLISLKSIISKDRNIANGCKGKILSSDIDQFSDFYCWAGVKPKGFLKIRGEKDEAPLLAERVRAYAQYVASLLLRRNFTAVSALFAPAVAGKFSADILQQTLDNLEKDYGSFDYFDRVEVMGVYCENHLNAETSDLMPVPAGIAPEQRCGEASFKLVSVYTPNGMPIHGVTVLIDIISEGDRLQLADMRWTQD